MGTRYVADFAANKIDASGIGGCRPPAGVPKS
jgi:hypothetical protein